MTIRLHDLGGIYEDIILPEHPGGGLTLGRKTTLPNSQRLFHDSISKEHVELKNTGSGLAAKVVGRNGVYVNKCLVKEGEVRHLVEGDVLTFLPADDLEDEAVGVASGTPNRRREGSVDLTTPGRRRLAHEGGSSTVKVMRSTPDANSRLEPSSVLSPEQRSYLLHIPLPRFIVRRRSPSPEMSTTKSAGRGQSLSDTTAPPSKKARR